jgi:hypothetical protein
MMFGCRFGFHKFVPYRYNWVEYMPTQQNPRFSKEGAEILSHVYCTVCGEIREVMNVEGKMVKYVRPAKSV